MAPINTTSEKFNPFPGLRPFNPEENEFFFGRENESEEITGKLLANRFVAVTGASASGKSSLIYCGLLPGLRSMSPKSFVWRFITMKPGSDPLENLAHALLEASEDTGRKGYASGDLQKILNEHPDGISEAIRVLSFRAGERILLVVDQFEELFRYGSIDRGTGSGTDAGKFMSLLANAITGNNQNIFIVTAIHSEYISECANNKRFTQLINHSNFLVPGMTGENLREVIEAPVRKAGAEIDSDLVEILVDDVTGRADQLLILQHAMMRTWARWKELDEPDRPLSYYDYDSVGTVKDAVSRHADELFEELDAKARIVCEKLFKFITGRIHDSRDIRYPARIETAKSALGCTGEELFGVIEKFRAPSLYFLNPCYGTELNDNSVIDFSRESMIRLWDRLQQWVDEEAESVQMYLRLSEVSAMYQLGKTGLLKQPELQLAINWREQNKPTLWWAQRYNPAFERAMVYLRTSEKDFQESEERKIRQQRRRLRRIRIISSVFAGIAILTVLAMIVMSISKIASDNLRKEAEMQKAELNARKNLAEEYAALALKRSVEADSNAAVSSSREKEARLQQIIILKRADSLRMAGLEAEETARNATQLNKETQRLRMISLARSMALRSQQMSGQKELQSLLAYQAYLFNRKNNGFSNDADIYLGLYNVAKQYGGPGYKSFTGHAGGVKSIAFLPGKSEFFTSGSDGKVLKWNLDDKNKGFQIVYSGSEIIDVLAVSPGADWLACGKEDAGIRMIPLTGNDEGFELKGHSGKIKSLIFSFDGKYLYSAALDGKVLKWDLAIKTSIDMSTDRMQITSIDLSSGGRYIAGVSDDGSALIWDPEVSTDRFRIESEGRSVRALKFNPGDERIAVGYSDGVVELWDLSARRKITGLQAHSGEIKTIRFSKTRSQMATAGSDGLLKLWDTGNLFNLPITFDDNGSLVLAVEISPDGEVIVSGSVERTNNLISRPAAADTFAADGCSYITRNFTHDEWLAYVGNDIEYEKTCPEADYKIRIREIR